MKSKIAAKKILAHLEVVRAWIDGATIQYYSNTTNTWVDVTDNDPVWDESTQYRVKSEPREWWINVYPTSHGGSAAHLSRAIADKFADPSRVECVHVKEVL